MKIVVDMNLSPEWVAVLEGALEGAGHTAIHWSSVGSPSATDSEIMKWARENRFIVFTHDLDFGAILAATNTLSPSVLQIRTNNPTPVHCARLIDGTLKRFSMELDAGALISVDEDRARIRVLPIDRK